MRIVTSPQQGFPYRLTHWQPARADLDCVVEEFVKTKTAHRAVIVHNTDRGWAVFSDGGDRVVVKQ